MLLRGALICSLGSIFSEQGGNEMNVFDFDKTLYKGDCTIDYWVYAMRHHSSYAKDLPLQLVAGARYAFGRTTKEEFKEVFYRFLQRLDDPVALAESFWNSATNKMNEVVLAHAQEGDLVVSASPRFLVEIPCKKLGLNLIASEVDIRSGKLESPNCYGEEKVRRIIEAGFPLQFEKGFFRFDVRCAYARPRERALPREGG